MQLLARFPITLLPALQRPILSIRMRSRRPLLMAFAAMAGVVSLAAPPGASATPVTLVFEGPLDFVEGAGGADVRDYLDDSVQVGTTVSVFVTLDDERPNTTAIIPGLGTYLETGQTRIVVGNYEFVPSSAGQSVVTVGDNQVFLAPPDLEDYVTITTSEHEMISQGGPFLNFVPGSGITFSSTPGNNLDILSNVEIPVDPALYALFPEGVIAIVGDDPNPELDDQGFALQAGFETFRFEIPEPSAALMIGLGLGLLGRRGRARR